MFFTLNTNLTYLITPSHNEMATVKGASAFTYLVVTSMKTLRSRDADCTDICGGIYLHRP